jgi:hypothetical protein
MKTTPLVNPVEYDEAIIVLLQSKLPNVQLAINLLRDARNLAEKKLTKIITRENAKANRTKQTN